MQTVVQGLVTVIAPCELEKEQVNPCNTSGYKADEMMCFTTFTIIQLSQFKCDRVPQFPISSPKYPVCC